MRLFGRFYGEELVECPSHGGATARLFILFDAFDECRRKVIEKFGTVPLCGECVSKAVWKEV